MPATPPMIASSALITLITDPLLSRRSRCARPGEARGSARLPRTGTSARPAALDVLQRGVKILLAAHPGDHALPEAARADRARHLVGAVEPEDGGLLPELRDLLGQLGLVVGEGVVLARRQEARLLAPAGVVLSGQERHHLLGVVVLAVEDRGEVTAAEHRLAVGRLPRVLEDTDLVVDVGDDLRREETGLGDEVALPVQETLRRVVEHRVG